MRQVLSSRNLTLYQVSRHSAEIFGRSSPYYVPQQLYSVLATGATRPSIYQVIALSRISGYRLSDWLGILGFELDDIPRLQLQVLWRRTVLLDPTIYDLDRWILWLTDRPQATTPHAITPLGQILRLAGPTRVNKLIAPPTGRFLYVKVGREDFFAFPELAPGSIARVEVLNTSQWEASLADTPSRRLFLVERGPILSCCRLRRVNGTRIALCSAVPPFIELDPTLGRRARILGMIDAEIRQVVSQTLPKLPAQTRVPAHVNGIAPQDTTTLGQLIQSSRIRTGLSFREASEMSRWIAKTLAHQNYFTSPGTLSDYEHLVSAPRHIEKIFSLCVLYSMGFWHFLRVAGLALDTLGTAVMPDELCGREHPPGLKGFDDQTPEQTPASTESANFLPTLVREWTEVPFFMSGALPEIAGLQRVSLSDIFWVGAERQPLHPYLANAVLVAVNRRLKKPRSSPSQTLGDQPIYVILTRDGYLCGCCTLRKGRGMVVHRQLEYPSASRENYVDAEVIGQVTAILRHFR